MLEKNFVFTLFPSRPIFLSLSNLILCLLSFALADHATFWLELRKQTNAALVGYHDTHGMIGGADKPIAVLTYKMSNTTFQIPHCLAT